MKKAPPNFPFFEVPAVARSVLPVLCAFALGKKGAVRDYHNFLDAPYLDGIIDAIRTGHIDEVGIPRAGFTSHGFVPHEEIYKRIARFGKPLGTNDVVIDDKGAELSAWNSAVEFGTSRADLPLDTAAGSTCKLRLRAIYSSVWVDHPQAGGIPYVLDQLWIIEKVNSPVGAISYYLVCVEIDGKHKWDSESNGFGSSYLTKQIVRSNHILSKDIGLYRIGSEEMVEPSSAKTNIEALAASLCDYELLISRGIAPHVICSKADLASLKEMKYKAT